MSKVKLKASQVAFTRIPAELDHHRAQSEVDNPNGRDSVLCEVTENHYS